MIGSTHGTRSQSDQTLAKDIARANPKKVEQPEAQLSYIKPINAFYAEAAGFFTRILIERTCFQNTHIPKEVWLYLGNDLIQALSVGPKESSFSMTKEISLLWKELKGEPLTKQERVYLDTPQQLDVLGEVLNGVKCATVYLIGQAWCSSVTSVVQNKLWSHIPAICAYTGTTLLGGQVVARAVQKVLSKTNLSDRDKQIVAPWLNMVGRLATGFVPKVHATDEGVHYHYPSTEGHTRTVTPDQTVTMRGDDLTVERSGTFNTPEGNFEAVHEAHFTLAEMTELNEESVKIQVITKEGNKVPVEFKLVQGLYGPEVTVHSQNQELERHWSQYFTKRLPSEPLSDAISGVREKLPSLLHIESKAVAVSCAIIGAAANPRQHSALASLVATLFVASLPSPVSAGLFKKIKKIITSPARNAAKSFGKEAKVAITKFDKMVQASIKEVKELEKEIMLDLDNLGKIFISEVDDELGVRVEQIEKGAKGIIEIAGVEARFTALAGGKIAIATIKEIREEFLEEVEQTAPRVVQNVVTEALKGVHSFFSKESQYEKLLNAIQAKMSQGAERTYRERMKDLLKFVQEQTSCEITPHEKASLYAELIRHTNTPKLSTQDRKWLAFIISCVASQDEGLREGQNKFLGIVFENLDHFESTVLPVVPHQEIRDAFSSQNFDHIKYDVIRSLYGYVGAFSDIDLMKECFFWSERETALVLKELVYQEVCERYEDNTFAELHKLLHPGSGKFFEAFIGLAKSEDLEFKKEFATLVQELGNQFALEAKHDEAGRIYTLLKELYVDFHGVHSEEVGHALIQMGSVLQKQGNNESAIKEYQNALEVLHCVHENPHKDTADTYARLGQAYKDLSQYKEAEESFQKAKKIVLSLFGPASDEMASCVEELGHLSFAQGEWHQARKRFKNALQKFEEVYGEQHSKVADNYRNIGRAFEALGNANKAEENFKIAKRINTDNQGENSPEVARQL